MQFRTSIHIPNDDEVPVYVVSEPHQVFDLIHYEQARHEDGTDDVISLTIPRFRLMMAKKGTYEVKVAFTAGFDADDNLIYAYYKTYDTEQYDKANGFHYGGWVIMSHDRHHNPYKVYKNTGEDTSPNHYENLYNNISKMVIPQTYVPLLMVSASQWTGTTSYVTFTPQPAGGTV